MASVQEEKLYNFGNRRNAELRVYSTMCRYRDNPISVGGDGNCFYYAFIESTKLEMNVDQLKRKMVIFESKFIQFEDGTIFRECMKPMAWVEDQAIMVLASLVGVRICIHYFLDTDLAHPYLCQVFEGSYQSTYTVHLNLSNNHYEGMRHSEDLSVFVNNSLNTLDMSFDTPVKHIMTVNNVKRKYAMAKPSILESVVSGLCFSANISYDKTLIELLMKYTLEPDKYKFVSYYFNCDLSLYEMRYNDMRASLVSRLRSPSSFATPMNIKLLEIDGPEGLKYFSVVEKRTIFAKTDLKSITPSKSLLDCFMTAVQKRFFTHGERKEDIARIIDTTVSELRDKEKWDKRTNDSNLYCVTLLCIRLKISLVIIIEEEYSKHYSCGMSMNMSSETDKWSCITILRLDNLFYYCEKSEPFSSPQIALTPQTPDNLDIGEPQDYFIESKLNEMLPQPEHDRVQKFMARVSMNDQPEIRYNIEYLGIDPRTKGYIIRVDKLNDFPLALESNPFVISKEDFKNFPHDFTFSHLSPNTDVKFRDAKLILGDSDDNKSPDFISIKGKLLNVVEFTTNQGHSSASLSSASLMKHLKYEDAINKRAERFNLLVRYDIIAVSKQYVCSTFDLPESIRYELFNRFKVALAIHNNVMEKGDYVKATSDLSIREDRILQCFGRVKLPEVMDELVDSDLINNCTRNWEPRDEEISMDYLVQALCSPKSRSELPIKDYFTSVAGECYRRDCEKFEKFQLGYETRADMKAPIQLPFCIPSNKWPNMLEGCKNEIGDLPQSFYDSHAKVWISAISRPSYTVQEDYISEIERMGMDIAEVEMIDERQKAYRKTRGRHTFVLSEIEEVELAKIGFYGKKHSDKFEVKEYRSYTKRVFDYKSTETKDIDDFISGSHTLWEKSDNEDERLESVIGLLEHASLIHDTKDSPKMLDILREYCHSKYGTFLRFLSDLATEICISLKQQCKSRQVIIKKLKFFDCLIMLKPCGLNNKIFVSLLFLKEDYDKVDQNIIGYVWKKVQNMGRFLVTEFVSFAIDKLVNLVRAESMGMCLISFWSEFYGICLSKTSIKNAVETDSRISKMFSLCILILLNDKHTLEEILTNTRFIHMERLVQFPNISQPSKMLEKISPVIRSRLEVWAIRRVFSLISEYHYDIMTHMPIIREGRLWKCFKNPFIMIDGNLDQFNDQDQMLSSCYLGYLRNKDDSPEKNCSGKLIEKILGYEEIIPKNADGTIDRSKLGRLEPSMDNIKTHEFSVCLIKDMCNSFLKKVGRQVGMDPKEFFTKQIIRKLSYEYLDTFATLKATSNFDKEWYVYDKAKKYHRSKVITKVLEILSNEDDSKDLTLVIDFFEMALIELERVGCLHICIFKKNQHGGLREIYVLDILGRIVQKVMEDISRSILEQSESEIMTHPENKFNIPTRHNREAKELYSGKYSTYATSDDASKWNQGHYVTKFAIMDCSLTQSTFHGSIIRSLKLWLNKKIKIPEDLLEVYDSNQMINTKIAIVMVMFLIFKGMMEGTNWAQQGQAYIKTETGMMQGILHYKSSCYHVLFLEWLKEKCSSLLNSVINKTECKGSRAIIDIMVSSDDSAMLVSVPTSSKEIENLWIAQTVNDIFNLKTKLGVMLGIYRSVKSTQFTKFVSEFNSEFSFFGDVHRPTFRWVNSCLLISEQENIMARQEESYNLTTSLIQGGGTFILAHLCHLSQGLQHYRMLGSSVSDVWPMYKSNIMTSMDPALGFFLVDHPLGTGLAGLSYLVWLFCTRTSLGIKYKQMYLSEINKGHSEKLKDITLETTTIGLFNRAAAISYGSNERWKKIMKIFETEGFKMDDYDINPELLYIKPRTVGELKQKLYLKMKGPGVISALGKGNALSRIIASSVYLLSRPIIITQSTFYSTKLEKKKIGLMSMVLFGKMLPIETKEIDGGFFTIIEVFRENDVASLIQFIDPTRKGTHLRDTEISVRHIMKNSRCGESIFQVVCNLLMVDIEIHTGDFIKNGKIKTYDATMLLCSNPTRKIIIAVYEGHWYMLGHNCPPEFSNSLTGFTQEEEDILFQHNKDYVVIRSIYDSISLQKSRPSNNQRRRKRCSIQITGSMDSVAISVEKVMVYFWFGRNPSHYDATSLSHLFTLYSKSIPWLRKSISETLSESPFTNHIQLQNFLSRLDRGNRFVHVVGSFTSARSSNIQIATIIKKNFSNGLDFMDLYKDNSYQQLKSVNVYLHALTLLSVAPVDEDYRINLVHDLLSKGTDYEVTSMTGSRAYKLSIIRTLVKKCPRLKYISKFETLEDIIKNKMQVRYGKSIIYVKENIDDIMDIVSSSSIDDLLNEKDPYLRYTYINLSDPETAEDFELVSLNDIVEDYLSHLTDNDKSLIKSFIGKNALKLFMDDTIKEPKDIVEFQLDFDQRMVGLISEMSKFRLGITGFYLMPQKYDLEKKEYTGTGVWVGNFGDVNVKITISSTKEYEAELQKVEFSSSANFPVTMKFLRTWCHDNHVVNNGTLDNTRTWGQVACYLYQFSENTKFTKGFCPVLISRNLSSLTGQEFVDYEIDLSDRSLRLIGYYNKNSELDPKHNLVTLLSIPLNVNLISREFNNIDTKNFEFIKNWPKWVQEWVWYKRGSEGLDLLLHWVRTNSNLTSKRIDESSFKPWLIKQWQEKIKQLYLGQRPPTHLYKIRDQEKFHEDLSDEIIDEYFKKMSEENTMTEYSQGFINEMVVGDPTIIEEAFGLEEPESKSSVILSYHPFIMPYFMFFGREFIMNVEASKSTGILSVPSIYKNEIKVLQLLYPECDIEVFDPAHIIQDETPIEF